MSIVWGVPGHLRLVLLCVKTALLELQVIALVKVLPLLASTVPLEHSLRLQVVPYVLIVHLVLGHFHFSIDQSLARIAWLDNILALQAPLALLHVCNVVAVHSLVLELHHARPVKPVLGLRCMVLLGVPHVHLALSHL